MIIFMGDGRLGNQLFQLAFLKNICRKKELIFAFSLEEVSKIFNLSFKIININIKNKKFKFIFRKVFSYFFETLAFFRIVSIVYEKKEQISYKKKIGIFWFISYVRSGFFQSEKFFNESQFLRNIKFKENYIFQAKSFLKNIPNSFTKVFIHVRRGDYVFGNYLGVKGINLPLSYYNSAISIVNNKIANPYYIILSDDFDFCELAFNNLENKIISQNDFGVDLAIMSLCSGGIISNSSYSWWGSILMKKRLIVVMPKYWYGWKIKKQSHVGINLSFADVIDF